MDSMQDSIEPEFKMSSNFIMRKIIYNYMNPTLIPFRNFRDEFIIKAFSGHISTQVQSLLHLYFLISENAQHQKMYASDYPSTEPEEAKSEIAESQAPPDKKEE